MCVLGKGVGGGREGGGGKGGRGRGKGGKAFGVEGFGLDIVFPLGRCFLLCFVPFRVASLRFPPLSAFCSFL